MQFTVITGYDEDIVNIDGSSTDHDSDVSSTDPDPPEHDDPDFDHVLMPRMTTSIMIERNSRDEILSIKRQDSASSPTTIYSRPAETCESTCQTEPEVDTCDSSAQTTEDTCINCVNAGRKLSDLCNKLEEAKIKNDEQVLILTLFEKIS